MADTETVEVPKAPFVSEKQMKALELAKALRAKELASGAA